MKTAQSIADIMSTPFYSQFTEEQIIAQLTTNAKQLHETADKAKRMNKKIGGYTSEQWKERAEHFDSILNTKS